MTAYVEFTDQRASNWTIHVSDVRTVKEKKPTPAAVKKAEDVVSTMLAKGFILGKDAINRAKSFDERHCLTSNASATVASIDNKMGLSDKLSIGTTLFNETVKEMNDKLLVSEMTKSAIAAAEGKVNSARSAIMGNPYLLTGASWMSSAYTTVANAVGNVSAMTKEKVEQADGRMHFDRSSSGGLPLFSVHSGEVHM